MPLGSFLGPLGGPFGSAGGSLGASSELGGDLGIHLWGEGSRGQFELPLLDRSWTRRTAEPMSTVLGIPVAKSSQDGTSKTILS